MGVGGLITFAVVMIILNGIAPVASASAATATPTATHQPTATQAGPTPTQRTSTQAPDATISPYPTPDSVGFSGDFALGGQVPGFIGHSDLMHGAGMTWVKYQIKWQPGLDAAEASQVLIDQGHSNGFRVLLSISGQTYPTSIDYEGFTEFVRETAAFQPDAIEIWNEENLDREWPAGQIDPAIYVQNMLIPAYDAIKAVSPNTAVIIGAPSPTGADNGTNYWSDQRYAQGLGAAGAANYADCMGVHHNAGTTPPSAREGHVFDSGDHHYSWYFLPTIEVTYQALNEALPICITEFGYLTADGIDQPLPENFAWAANTTLQNQADWLAEGVGIARNLGYVRLVTIWNVDFDTWGDDPFMGFAIVRPDGSCPACTELHDAMQN